MPDVNAALDQLASKARDTRQPVEITVRELLGLFGAERRGVHVVNEIRRQLRKRHVTSEPDFEGMWLDASVRILPTDTEGKAVGNGSLSTGNGSGDTAGMATSTSSREEPALVSGIASDPVQRIGRLSAANRGVRSVPPGVPLGVAVSQMILKNFSQIPVIHGARDCRGAVTWQSIATKLALGQTPSKVDDCLEPVEIVEPDAKLFQVIPRIVEAGFVLVRGRDRTLQGIVTPADLADQFRILSEPFLLLGQIENHLRIILQRRLLPEEILAGRDLEQHRPVADVSDLSFGDYVRLFEPVATWPRFGFKLIDRGSFIEALKRVHQMRNAVMHFDPDGVEPADLETLREFARMIDLLAGL